VNGIFDYDNAAWADLHHDFRYLLFDVGREDGEDMLEAARAFTSLQRVDRSIVPCSTLPRGLINFLSFRAGTPAEQKSYRRTPAEVIRWRRAALSKLAP
jgi:hypothetical protein